MYSCLQMCVHPCIYTVTYMYIVHPYILVVIMQCSSLYSTIIRRSRTPGNGLFMWSGITVEHHFLTSLESGDDSDAEAASGSRQTTGKHVAMTDGKSGTTVTQRSVLIGHLRGCCIKPSYEIMLQCSRPQQVPYQSILGTSHGTIWLCVLLPLALCLSQEVCKSCHLPHCLALYLNLL